MVGQRDVRTENVHAARIESRIRLPTGRQSGACVGHGDLTSRAVSNESRPIDLKRFVVPINNQGRFTDSRNIRLESPGNGIDEFANAFFRPCHDHFDSAVGLVADITCHRILPSNLSGRDAESDSLDSTREDDPLRSILTAPTRHDLLHDCWSRSHQSHPSASIVRCVPPATLPRNPLFQRVSFRPTEQCARPAPTLESPGPHIFA